MLREMKAKFVMFTALLCAINGVAGAVTIKKAAPVTTQKKEVMNDGAALLPGVLNLISGVQQITQQNKALKAECVPSSSEISFVNKMIKEWAKTGARSATDVWNSLEVEQCGSGDSYQESVRYSSDPNDIVYLCYDSFNKTEDDGAIWKDMPKASIATYCTDGSSSCQERFKRTASNVYEVFALIDFDVADYTKEEATQKAKLQEKMEKCAPAKLLAKQREVMSGTVNQLLGSVGGKTDTANVMDALTGVLGNIGGGGGATGVIQSLSGVASSLLIKE